MTAGVHRPPAAALAGFLAVLCTALAATPAAALTLTHSQRLPPPDMAFAPASGSQALLASAALRLSGPRPLQWWQHVAVRPGDSLTRIFARAGLARDQWRAVMDLGDAVEALAHLQPGQRLALRRDAAKRLQGLRLDTGPLDTLIVERAGHGLHAHTEHRLASLREARVTGQVTRSLAQGVRDAGASAVIAARLAHIFRWRADLSRQMRRGDHFTVIYEKRYADGQRLSDGQVLAARIHVDGRTLVAVRHTDADGAARYYDRDGRSYAASIERTPLRYDRVSSPFSLSRINPVTHRRCAHTGVDLTAAMGTPVHAAANGTVEFRGRLSGYGRVIELAHVDGYETRYAHLSKFAPGLRDGQRVRQDQVIGYVGMSGRTTGPHLHYEIRHDGVPHDPLHVALPSGRRLAGSALARLSRDTAPLLARLDDAAPHPQAESATQVAALCVPPAYRDALDIGGDDGVLLALLCTPKAS